MDNNDSFLAQQKFLIIGNGPSVLEHELGEHIDDLTLQGFKIVRFNNYQLFGYEKYVGSLTHVQARRACDDVRLPPLSEIERVWCFVTYGRWASGMQIVARDVKAYYGDSCTVIPIKECMEIGAEIGLDQPYVEHASVGILCLGWLTQRVESDRIIVHGFDGLQPDSKTGTVRHYFHKPTKDARFHNSAKEVAYLRKLNLITLTEFILGTTRDGLKGFQI